MTDKSDSALIRADEAPAFNLWDLPSFDEGGHHVPREEEQLDAEQEQAQEAVEDVPDEPEVKPFTVEELEQIRTEAYNEGFATGERDGFHSGQLKAQQEAKIQLDARVAELEAVMMQLMEPIRGQDEQIEDMLLELVETMVRQVVQRELTTDSRHKIGRAHV